ncbi:MULTISPECIES: hypothetical protein [Methylobacterium]|jgi:hypothetical protein|uniref:hypothetical protein n=1 Tax=Methylobacterium TaxID=407 RepID=UPI0008F11315|nr:MULTISPECIES: hypothetical protein [Methylobacterium]MBZ6414612.1 hypothetical protein [Methylobacterium sp.]MBK3398885.1 hypothetical protein [Methylobacterium ajmalii]MBK3408042.1 hypothetical protein [Methylobacterium ajmalii]MBK3425509.1 hypothetical protein [Methylobacterium ajmalii]SFF47820.1 hypothetical protein SAMN04487844_12191 [Methylobacterium sp. yr596]
MTNNMERFKNDLTKLINLGDLLLLSMKRDLSTKEDFRETMIKIVVKDKLEQAIKQIPNFDIAYEAWFSESLSVIRQLTPDRVGHFTDLYEVSKNRKDIDHSTYKIQDYLNGLRVRRFAEVVVNVDAAYPKLKQQVYILKAVQSRFESSLFEIRQLVQADLFDAEIDSAKELLKKGFLRAAGAVSGVVLERHLAQVCKDHHLKTSKKNPSIGDLNEILKANSVIDVPQWRYISMLADIRNICDHSKSKEPTEIQVADLIEGTDKILKTIS